MRYILIGLGVITVVLAVVLAREALWWAAIPDAAFGIGVGWVAFVSLRDEKRGVVWGESAPAAMAAPAASSERAPLLVPPPVSPTPNPVVSKPSAQPIRRSGSGRRSA